MGHLSLLHRNLLEVFKWQLCTMTTNPTRQRDPKPLTHRAVMGWTEGGVVIEATKLTSIAQRHHYSPLYRYALSLLLELTRSISQ